MPPVEGKVVIVTGASSGIGEAIVRELVEAGMIVAGLARRIDRVEALAKSLAGKKGKLHPVKCDVTSEDDIKKAFAWVEKNLGSLTALVNNAGVLRACPVAKQDIKDIKLMFDTNVVGLAACSKEAINAMLSKKIDGTIININSVAGHWILPFPGIQGYNASKWAVTAFTEGLRNEISLHKANIRITSLSPGAVESEMTDQFKKEGEENVLENEFQMLPAKDIADCVLFVLQTPQRMTISELTVLPTTETMLTEAKAFVKMLPNFQ